jgi:hypothetical protein
MRTDQYTSPPPGFCVAILGMTAPRAINAPIGHLCVMTTPPPGDTGSSLSFSRPERKEYDLGPVRCFREELVELAQIIAEECGGVEIDFHDDRGTTGNSPAAFADYAAAGNPERLRRLTVSGRRGATVLAADFTPAGARLTVEEPDNSARGAAERIRANLRPPRITPYFAAVAAVLVAVLGYWGGQLFSRADHNMELSPGGDVWVTVVLLLAGWTAAIASSEGGLGLRGMKSGSSRLVNAPRVERPGHWERHRVLYLSNGATTILGGVIGYLANQAPPL